jgi:hypothetical protein
MICENQCFCDVVVWGHLLGAESNQIEFCTNGKPFNNFCNCWRWSQMDVKFPAVLVLEDQVSSEFGFAGSILAWMSIDLLQVA